MSGRKNKAFLNNWDYGPDDIGNEVQVWEKGLIHREGSHTTGDV